MDEAEVQRKLKERIKNFPVLIWTINEERAYAIRWLRCELGCSWRSVAYRCHSIFGSGWCTGWDTIPENQLVGQELCDAAAIVLGEDPDKKPWN
jgi:hypothetical protein